MVPAFDACRDGSSDRKLATTLAICGNFVLVISVGAKVPFFGTGAGWRPLSPGELAHPCIGIIYTT